MIDCAIIGGILCGISYYIGLWIGSKQKVSKVK